MTNFIINLPVTLECYTHESGYSSLSFSFSPAPGHTVNGQPSSITSLPGGGIRRSTTFTMTAGLNGTMVVCFAFNGNKFAQSRHATILGQKVPDLNDNFHYCSLSNRLFFSWNSVLPLEGIVIQYRITENHQNKTIDKPPYSMLIVSGLYRGNITVIVNVTASNQITYGEPMPIKGT